MNKEERGRSRHSRCMQHACIHTQESREEHLPAPISTGSPRFPTRWLPHKALVMRCRQSWRCDVLIPAVHRTEQKSLLLLSNFFSKSLQLQNAEIASPHKRHVGSLLTLGDERCLCSSSPVALANAPSTHPQRISDRRSRFATLTRHLDTSHHRWHALFFLARRERQTRHTLFDNKLPPLEKWLRRG